MSSGRLRQLNLGFGLQDVVDDTAFSRQSLSKLLQQLSGANMALHNRRINCGSVQVLFEKALLELHLDDAPADAMRFHHGCQAHRCLLHDIRESRPGP